MSYLSESVGDVGTSDRDRLSQSTLFDKADGQHLSDFDATSHIWLSSYKKTFD